MTSSTLVEERLNLSARSRGSCPVLHAAISSTWWLCAAARLSARRFAVVARLGGWWCSSEAKVAVEDLAHTLALDADSFSDYLQAQSLYDSEPEHLALAVAHRALAAANR
jgi:hypothetical protein